MHKPKTMARLDEIVLIREPKGERLVAKLSREEILGTIEGLDPITLYFWARKYNREALDDYRRDYGSMRSDNSDRLRGPDDKIEEARMEMIIDSFRKKHHIAKWEDETEHRNYLKLLEMHYARLRKDKPRHISEVLLGVHYFLMRMAYFDHFPPEYVQRQKKMERRYFMHGVPSLKENKED